MKGAEIRIRNLQRSDLEAIVDIDQNVLGENRREHWERKLETMDARAAEASFVAEVEGTVVAFVLGNVSGWEFGVPDTIGWIDTIGVDPAHQKKGIAAALVRALFETLRSQGVQTVYTLVSWDDWDLLQFFRAVGFRRGDMINLELKI